MHPLLTHAAPAIAAAVLLSACTTIGPTQAFLPGAGRTDADVALDRRACMTRTDAMLQPLATAESASTTAAALTGNGSAGATAAAQNADMQVRYDQLYGGCMSAHGDTIVAAAARTDAVPEVLPAAADASPRGAPVRDPAAAAVTPVASPEVEAIYAAAGLKRRGDNLLDECDTAVTPQFEDIHLGGVVGDAVEVDVPDNTCFGGAGMQVTVLRRMSDRFVDIEQDNAAKLIFYPTQHRGVADIGLSEPGMQVPVLQWNGSKYVAWKVITVHGYTM